MSNSISIPILLDPQLSQAYAPQLSTLDKLCNRPPWTERLFEEEFKLSYSKIYVILEPANKTASNNPSPENIIAFISLQLIIDELTIANFGVHPDQRTKGLGSLLLEKTINYADSEKVKSITLEVRESNIKAINLYQKFGFIEVGKRPGYYVDDRETAIIMERRAPARLL